MSEEWRPLPEYEGRYEVSNLGRLRSCPGGRRSGKVLKLRLDRDGYPRLNVTSGAPYSHRTLRVADCVLKAFIGSPAEGHVARHRNGIRSDCRLSNLRYGTPDDNRLDAIEHGTFSKVTAAQALEIRARALDGERMTSLAEEFGIHYQSVYRIKKGIRWGAFLERNCDQLLAVE